MEDFVEFLFSKTYNNNFYYLKNTKYINMATEMTIEDVKYHYKEKTSSEIISNIKSNGNELVIFLYRLGNLVYHKIDNEDVWKNIHWIMRECCSCEIFFSSNIDIGFYVVHGLGTVLGPRHEIGKGFKVYQGCTVGQRNSTEDKCIIGDNVTLYSNSAILGSIKIGNMEIMLREAGLEPISIWTFGQDTYEYLMTSLASKGIEKNEFIDYIIKSIPMLQKSIDESCLSDTMIVICRK